jgi:hypothetical protein
VVSRVFDRNGRQLGPDWSRCPVCNGLWRRWAKSLLPCHAKCLFSPDLQDDLLLVLDAFAGRVSHARLARDMGVSRPTLDANLHQARLRRLNRTTRRAA